MAAIDHEHVISIYQVGEANGIPFLAMPLLKGESLEARLRREGRLPLPEVLRIGREMAEGLEAAHASGLVHRDVKPSNVWLESGRGRVKILDFGLARGKEDTQLTQAGSVVGTPAYMAPEQADGTPVTLRCDLYSLGCVLYRMSAGQVPFQGQDVTSVLKKVLLDTPRPLHELNAEAPPELSRLVAKLMAKDPAARPARARLVANDLQAIEQSAKSETASPGSVAIGPSLPRLALLCWGAGVLMLGLVVVVVVMARNSSRQSARDAITPPAPEERSEANSQGHHPSVPAPKAIEQPAADKSPPGWQSFSPPGGRFTVLLPGEPKQRPRSRRRIEGRRSSSFSSSGRGAARALHGGRLQPCPVAGPIDDQRRPRPD